MSREKKQKVIVSVAVAMATILAWISGYIVMQIVYDSVVASIVFGTVWAVLVFCESRFSYISLRIDGRIEITKEEVKSNLWQIVAATLLAILVSIPLELKAFVDDGADLGEQINSLVTLFPERWLVMTMITLGVIAIFQVPIFARMASER